MPKLAAVGHSVVLHFVESRPAGEPRRQPVVLLHGFPEFSYSWRNQLPALAAAGFRAIAPDLRGYGRSPKPPRVRDYRIELLAADVLDLIGRECGGRAHLVGHDWGGVIAWWVAMHHPDAVERLVILNAPHPVAYSRELRRPAQMLRSWYVAFFQLPWLPEFAMRFDDLAAIRRVFETDPGRPGAFTPDDVSKYVHAFGERRALTGAINYYRAAFRQVHAHLGARARPIETPTLLIWGERDRYLVAELASGLESWVSNLRVERLPNASHWVQHDEPGRVNELLVEFLGSSPSTERPS
jgi:pimeloyl-ACP methyl ester carboxylesterase